LPLRVTESGLVGPVVTGRVGAGQARFAEQDSSRLTEIDLLPDMLTLLRVTQRGHPVAPDAHRRVRAVDPWAVRRVVVLLRTAEPRVVAQLVVIDRRDDRVTR